MTKALKTQGKKMKPTKAKTREFVYKTLKHPDTLTIFCTNSLCILSNPITFEAFYVRFEGNYILPKLPKLEFCHFIFVVIVKEKILSENWDRVTLFMPYYLLTNC